MSLESFKLPETEVKLSQGDTQRKVCRCTRTFENKFTVAKKRERFGDGRKLSPIYSSNNFFGN